MPTCSVPTANRTHAKTGPVTRSRNSAFTLVELIVVLSMLALFVMVAQANLFGILRRSTF